VSVNRHESTELADMVVQLAVDHIADGVVGIDLAGNEAEFSADSFLSIFKDARKAGLHITIHAGEWGGAGNIRQAILDFEAERIGHGVRILEDPTVVALAREHATPLEMCLSSNYQSGVVPSIQAHPFPAILAAGLNASLHTDDPGISQITLSSEYQLACEMCQLPLQMLFNQILSAAHAAFLKPDHRQELIKELESTFSKIQI
jgi:adenosine deaminase